MLFSIQKYARKLRVSKSSTPKLILGCPAVANLALGLDYVSSSEGRGRVFESAVGMDLLRISGGEVFWWRDGDDEVDFIFKMQQRFFAVEVKSGRRKRTSGIEAFLKIEKFAVPCFITLENYSKFSLDPVKFLLARC